MAHMTPCIVKGVVGRDELAENSPDLQLPSGLQSFLTTISLLFWFSGFTIFIHSHSVCQLQQAAVFIKRGKKRLTVCYLPSMANR